MKPSCPLCGGYTPVPMVTRKEHREIDLDGIILMREIDLDGIILMKPEHLTELIAMAEEKRTDELKETLEWFLKINTNGLGGS
jgi:hypothetical protein